MISRDAELELRATVDLARGMSKAYGGKQVAFMFAALADRVERLADEHTPAAVMETRYGRLAG